MIKYEMTFLSHGVSIYPLYNDYYLSLSSIVQFSVLLFPQYFVYSMKINFGLIQRGYLFSIEYKLSVSFKRNSMSHRIIYDAKEMQPYRKASVSEYIASVAC